MQLHLAKVVFQTCGTLASGMYRQQYRFNQLCGQQNEFSASEPPSKVYIRQQPASTLCRYCCWQVHGKSTAILGSACRPVGSHWPAGVCISSCLQSSMLFHPTQQCLINSSTVGHLVNFVTDCPGSPELMQYVDILWPFCCSGCPWRMCVLLCVRTAE